MPSNKELAVADLHIDLENYRTMPQKNEVNAVHALIATDPDWFWALTASLMEDEGYLPTENIIVLKTSGGDSIVKEGNRRIGALKLIFGLVPTKTFSIPADILDKIAKLGTVWKKANAAVPCAIYAPSEAAQVDRIVSLIHGKGQMAGRLSWNTVARARHNREEGGINEPGLDLLEDYLQHGKNFSKDQAERWSAEFPISVVEEMMKRVAPRIGFASATDLAFAYPGKIGTHRATIDTMMLAIGNGILDFKALRDATTDFGAKYGIPAPTGTGGGTTGSSGSGSTGASGSGANRTGTGSNGRGGGSGGGKGKPAALSLTDPKSVRRVLVHFKPRGHGREKLAHLVTEGRALNIDKTPLAFCFVLRSMFEISAKAYCTDHAAAGLAATDKSGNDRQLVDVLNDVVKHLTNGGKDAAAKKKYHGPITELRTPSGVLSITSMNQLIHGRSFSLSARQICTMFHNIFPLLEAMNS